MKIASSRETSERVSMYRSICLALLLCPPAAFAQIGFNLTSIARPGDAAPVPPRLVAVYSISLNDSGDVALGADNAALLQSNGTTTIVAAFGDPLPGGGTVTYATSPSVDGQGQVAFAANVAQGGIFLSTQDGLQPIVRLGDPAPGGGTFSSFSNVTTSIDGGQLAFRAFVRMGVQSRIGVFLASGGVIRLVAYMGDP